MIRTLLVNPAVNVVSNRTSLLRATEGEKTRNHTGKFYEGCAYLGGMFNKVGASCAAGLVP